MFSTYRAGVVFAQLDGPQERRGDGVQESNDSQHLTQRAVDTQDAQVTARCSVTYPRADALGDGVEQGLADVTVESSVYRGRAKEIGKAVPVEPLNGPVPADDRCAEQAAGVVDQSPTLAVGAYLVLEWRMTFGNGDVIAENDPAEQEKTIKFTVCWRTA
jgi:hypothetical protein